MRDAESRVTPRITKLQQALADLDLSGDSGPIRALRLGIRTFMDRERIDMSAMARELDINRATLYRWVGSREQFLVELIWFMTVRTLNRLDAEVNSTGPDRIVDLTIRFSEQVIENPGMKHWLATEGESAMALLTRAGAGYQPRLIAWTERMIEQEISAGNFSLPEGVDAYELAYVIERVMGGYIYLDLITGERPDARRAEPLLKMLLR
jgi:AcrR family transcriptional regulator